MVNRFDEKYDIRLAKLDEIPKIMEFIDNYWKKGHILATNRNFFEYEMVVDGKVNFLLAITKDGGEIEGLIGFLPCSRDLENLDIWGVIWKTVPGALPMLGMELKKRILDIVGARTDLGVGANSGTSVPLLSRIYRYYTEKMKHYYRLADIDTYNIAKVEQKIIPKYLTTEMLSIKKIYTEKELKEFYNFDNNKMMIPYKDEWYYNKRFLEHPIYRYEIWGLEYLAERALMVTRVQAYEDSSVIRIVDYHGNHQLFSYCGHFFDSLLKKYKYEYIDFYFDGFDEEYVKQAGMIEVSEGDTTIIPDYFNPFSQVNVDIYVVSSNNQEKCIFFKADGDQDRPN